MSFKRTPFSPIRIMRTALMLLTIPPAKFDLNSWASHKDDRIDAEDQCKLGVDISEMEQGESCNLRPNITTLAHTCGTTACALGYAGSIDENIAEGLQLIFGVYKTKWYSDLGGIAMMGSHVEYTTHTASGRKITYRDFVAGAKFFGISVNESHNLFAPSSYEAPGKPLRSDYPSNWDGTEMFGDAINDWEYATEEWTAAPIDVVNKMEALLRKYGYHAEADQLADAPRFVEVKWANQFGSGVKYDVRSPSSQAKHVR